MANKEPDWTKIRATAFSTSRPPEWPTHVTALTWNGHALFGMDQKTGEIYWDGHKLISEKRWGTVERRIAIVGLIIASIGVIATVAQAIAAFIK